MEILRESLAIVSVVNGYALYGKTRQGEAIFVAHLGDGADGVPSPNDPELPDAYGFTLTDADTDHITCPQCSGTGLLYPGATCGMWGGLARWPADVQGEPCDLCDGAGEVTAEEANAYEQAVSAGLAE